jgi:cysteine-rich repeat protein
MTYRWGLLTGVMGVLVSLAALAGCLETTSVTCSDSRVCPSGFVCDDAHGGCARLEQVNACASKADFDECSYGNTAGGVCSMGVCLPAGCGNALVEPGEMCDDGNNFRGDGCSADCLSNETCGNGEIDPVNGESCDDGNTASGDGCQANCVTPSCGDGVKDTYEGCDQGAANADTANAACRTNCQPKRCGDRIEDAGEVCDDGNQLSGDNCSFDCLSREVCGNGYLDYAKLEVCDDADSLSHDGCGTCQPESAAWSTPAPTTAINARMETAMAYDAARGKVVLFGGQWPIAGVYTDQTWTFDGGVWAQLRVAGPSARGRATMVYDANRKVIVLFGGRSLATLFDETWEWNGREWKNVTPTGQRPSPREYFALAYDAARKRVVLFGGNSSIDNSTPPLDDTWEWNGTTWTNVSPATGNPDRRSGHAMVYDPGRNRIVMFGGCTSAFCVSGTELSDTWEWNGTAWSNVTPTAGSPDPRGKHAMTYDPVAGRVLMYGGFAAGYLGDAWHWNGTGWDDVSTGAPPGRYGASLAFDLARSRAVLFGGNNGNFMLETWERSGTAWSEVTPPPPSTILPSGRHSSAMAYDTSRGRFFIFSGRTSSYPWPADLWEWKRAEGAWRLRTPAQDTPPFRFGHAMAYDPVRDRLVMFGGHDGTNVRQDTWEWDGTDWEDVTPASGNPGPRYYHALAYDPLRNRIVLYGGRDGVNENVSGNTFSDTWEWNGVAWTSAQTSLPSGRYGHALAYDLDRERLVLFGGLDSAPPSSATNIGETWERDTNGTWANVTPTFGSPRPRHYHGLAYDAHRGRTVLFGGWTSQAFSNDLWQWDGTTWSLIDVIDPLATPTVRYGHMFGFDTRNGELLLFGGDDAQYRNETRILRFDRGYAEDGCYGYDGDLDGVSGCSDHDCYAACTPLCNPSLMTCTASGPRCGDSVCQPIENARLCPADCGALAPRCGDYLCNGTETTATCAGDCTL